MPPSEELTAQASTDEAALQGQAGETITGTTEPEQFDKDRALETIRKQRESEKALAKQLKEAQAALKAYQDKDKERQEADLSELEKTKKRLAELEEAYTKASETAKALQLRHAFSRAIAAANLKFASQQAEDDAYELADKGSIEITDDKITGMDEAIKALQKSRPYLFSNEKDGVPGTPKRPDKAAKPDKAPLRGLVNF